MMQKNMVKFFMKSNKVKNSSELFIYKGKIDLIASAQIQ